MKIIAHSESQEVNLVAKLAELGFGQFDSDLGGPESELGKDAENQNQKRLAARVLKYASMSSSLHLYSISPPCLPKHSKNTLFVSRPIKNRILTPKIGHLRLGLCEYKTLYKKSPSPSPFYLGQ